MSFAASAWLLATTHLIFLTMYFSEQKFEILIVIGSILLKFVMDCAFGVESKILSPNSMSHKFSLIRSLIVLHFTFMY